MSYLEEFEMICVGQNSPRFLRLWEEYCLADTVDGGELITILQIIKDSPLAPLFGEYAETVLPLWKQIQDPKTADEVLRLLLDLQTSNSPILAELAIETLKRKYPNAEHLNEKFRITGLRGKQDFQGAISNFELLHHFAKGNFVFHHGGWGVGEVMEVSWLREHVLIEFEGISTLKEVSFENSFKTLVPLPSDHFLARRFGNPDQLEKDGKEDPSSLIHLLLRDLGPKTAAEIKDELCGLVIPEEDWSKWWQLVRNKLKKDTKIKAPASAKEPFELRKEELSHEQRFSDALSRAVTNEALIQVVYNFTRDFPDVLKNQNLKQQTKEVLEAALKITETPTEYALAHRIQILFLLEDLAPSTYTSIVEQEMKKIGKIEAVLPLMDIVAFKKKLLVKVREGQENWQTAFLHLLFTIDQNPLRDYLFKELMNDAGSREILIQKLKELVNRVTLFPEAFFWYFQKLVQDEKVPLNDTDNKRIFLEAFLVLLHYLENDPNQRELVKKMYHTLTEKRYAVVRSFIHGSNVAYLQEFLLLASKCHSLSKQDHRILQSLAEVVQPSLGSSRKEEQAKEEVIWTTTEGFKKIQERINHIGTVETVDNAREIEAARAHGDLRENSEYKFALERRARLQAELKMLSRQINQARILTPDDISTEEVSVGTIVEVIDSKGHKVRYTLLGPWDADPNQHILSFQSKLAQAMIGCRKGETFEFQGENFTVKAIESFL